MNIWIINPNATPPSLGGLNRHYYFKKYLEEMGHSVRIFTQGCIYNRNVDFFAKHEKCQVKVVNVDGCDYTFINVQRYKNIIQRLHSIHRFCTIIKKTYREQTYERPDLLYLSYSPEIEVGLFFGKLARKNSLRCVIECRDLYPESLCSAWKLSKKSIIYRIINKIVYKTFKYANNLIFTIPNGKQYLIDKKWAAGFGGAIELDHVYFIPNGLDLVNFENLKMRPYNDPDLNDPNNICFVFTGSIGRFSNYAHLIEIAKRIKNPHIKFLIWGGGCRLNAFKDTLSKSDVKNIIYKGIVSNEKIPSILQQSYGTFDLIQFQYWPLLWRYGTSQNKMTQYCAAGRPLVISKGVSQMGAPIEKIGVNIDEQPEECAQKLDAFVASHPKGSAAYESVCKCVLSAAYKRDYKIITNMLIKALF